MNIRYGFSLFLIACFSFSISSDLIAQVTIEQCQQKAKENYPLSSSYGLIEKSRDYNISNAKRMWVPQIGLSAQATYQSENISFPQGFADLYKTMTGETLKGLNRDQYKVALQIEQLIWDGGYSKAVIDQAKYETEVEIAALEVDLYSLNERVNQLFFGILLLKENIEEVQLYEKDLNRGAEKIDVLKNNGLASQKEVTRINIEKLKLKQRLTELSSTVDSYCMVLTLLTGIEITSDTELVTPQFNRPSLEINRYELTLFEAQLNALESKKRSINSATMPRFGAFIQGAYGYPGLNMFESMATDAWSPYYVAGLSLQWNISSFYTKKSNYGIIENSSNKLRNNREAFIFNTNMAAAQKSNEIDKRMEMIEIDKQIIDGLETILGQAENEFENGVITLNDLLEEMNALSIARQNMIVHQIELLNNLYDLKNTLNQ